MRAILQVESRVIPLPNENVDTDQIIPARFLKTTERTGLGKVLFYDWRYDASGRPKPDFILNQSRVEGAEILLAGNNFGCGSSREHAPWALADFGFRALISTSFADIFRNNCLKNGILPVSVDPLIHRELFKIVAKDPDTRVNIDLEQQTATVPGMPGVRFDIDPYSKKCLLEGLDDIGYLLQRMKKIEAYEKRSEVR